MKRRPDFGQDDAIQPSVPFCFKRPESETRRDIRLCGQQGEFPKAGQSLTADGAGGVQLPDAGEGMAAFLLFQILFGNSPFAEIWKGEPCSFCREIIRTGIRRTSPERARAVRDFTIEARGHFEPVVPVPFIGRKMPGDPCCCLPSPAKATAGWISERKIETDTGRPSMAAQEITDPRHAVPPCAEIFRRRPFIARGPGDPAAIRGRLRRSRAGGGGPVHHDDKIEHRFPLSWLSMLPGTLCYIAQMTKIHE